jgi:hypothetical protein
VKASVGRYLAREIRRQAFTPAVILFIALPLSDDKPVPGVTQIDLQQMPRRCPLCKQASIIGHGKRRKQAHDEQQDWIWVRRGLCRLCGKTFTILPSWSPPYAHYSLHCRHQAWEAICAGSDWDQAAPHCKDPTRSPDPTTLRRWAWRRLLSLGQSLKVWLWTLDWHDFLQAPTILAWDWMAAGHILLVEARDP